MNYTGSGQFRFALVNADGSETFWSNDGSSANGSPPTDAVTLTVTGGLYSVLLGDASIPNMSAVPATVFANEDVRLRVWFDDGTHGSQLLTPDQRVAAVGYALMADGVKAGGVTSAMIAAGAVGSAQLADGAVGSAQLGAGAAAANLNASGQSGVAAGGLVLSATDNNPALQAAGYVRIGATTTSDAWVPRAAVTPAARSAHAAVWTGAEMIVWGGQGSGGALAAGARYRPASNNWTPISPDGAPTARDSHTAVWTGAEMIVWGGSGLNTGGRFHPASDAWTGMTTTDAPAARSAHTAVWTGAEMIVWGGSGGGYLDTGGRYDPASDRWTALPPGAPSGRSSHTAVWTGREMIVWGGFAGGIPPLSLGTGGRYDPANDAWAATGPAPEPRDLHTAVWTGTDMIVWGGLSNGAVQSTGRRYDPASDTWSATTSAGAPAARYSHTAVWTGSEMIVWGGTADGSLSFDSGGRYDAAADAWTPLAGTGARPRAPGTRPCGAGRK